MSEPTELELKLQAEAVAEAEARMIETQTLMLYSMQCFDVIPHPEGYPMVTRVPGGWIWYIRSGGASISTTEGRQIVGNYTLHPTFVPYHNEFQPPTN